MLITKLKTKIYIGVTKKMKAKSFTECPSKGLVLEFESLSNTEALQLSILTDKLKNDEVNAAISFLEYSQKLVKGIHNSSITPEQLGVDVYMPVIMELFNTSILKEDDTYFLE